MRGEQRGMLRCPTIGPEGEVVDRGKQVSLSQLVS